MSKTTRASRPAPAPTAAPPGLESRFRWAGRSLLGTLLANAVLCLLVIWAADPQSLSWGLTVVSQDPAILAALILAIALPPALFGVVQIIGQAAAKGDYRAARRLLRPAVGVGFILWIVPGIFLWEALQLLPNPTPGQPQGSRSAPAR